MIIGFSPNSSRIIPRIFCRHIRHCAPIMRVAPDRYIMYQFIHRHHIALIYLTPHAIGLLRGGGWRFIDVPCAFPRDFMRGARACLSCVEFSKHAIGLRAWYIITPWALYKKARRLARRV